MSAFAGLEAWGLYLLAALLTLIAWYRISARMRWLTLRDLLRVAALAGALTPAPVPGFSGSFAPAWLVAFFEGVLQPGGDPLPATTLLLVVLLVLMAAVAGWRFLRPEQERMRGQS